MTVTQNMPNKMGKIFYLFAVGFEEGEEERTIIPELPLKYKTVQLPVICHMLESDLGRVGLWAPSV